ncbi:MAG: site-2 protease family protein [Acidobacteriia bacterium]|nr:site-2 protease family protein [Terriglobia bacterium]
MTDSSPEAGLYAFAEEFRARPRHRYWLHALLLVATLLSTTVVGAGMARSFAQNRPIDFWESLTGYQRMWHEPSYLLPGLPFSLTLLTILLAHEFGHFLTARYYLVDASLPFFIPFPSLIGTMGAFIRIRSAILSKRILFDIGIAGPLAGFVALVSPLVAGVALSKVVPGIGHSGDLVFGTPLILRLIEWVRFPGVPVGDIYLHPVARAAWVGLLATALNLLPIGQLDGGHILYAFLGERTRYLSRLFIFILVLMGAFIAYSWLVWAALLFFFGMRHPAIVDPHPLGRLRTRLAVLALAILLLSFTAAPVS